MAELLGSKVVGETLAICRGCGELMLGLEFWRFSKGLTVEGAVCFSGEKALWKRFPMGSLFSDPMDIDGMNDWA